MAMDTGSSTVIPYLLTRWALYAAINDAATPVTSLTQPNPSLSEHLFTRNAGRNQLLLDLEVPFPDFIDDRIHQQLQ